MLGATVLRLSVELAAGSPHELLVDLDDVSIIVFVDRCLAATGAPTDSV